MCCIPFWCLYHNYHMCISVLVSLDTFESIPSVTCNDRMTLSWNRFDKVGDQLMRLVGNSRADVHLLPGCPPRWSHARPWFNQLKCAVVAKKLCSLNEEFWSNYSSDNCKNSGWSLMLMLQLFQLWILYYLFSIDTNYQEVEEHALKKQMLQSGGCTCCWGLCTFCACGRVKVLSRYCAAK